MFDCHFIELEFLLLQVIAATNRADILDPALMRSGRLDRKIEFPHPTEEARARIMQVFMLPFLLCCLFSCNIYKFFRFIFLNTIVDPLEEDERPPRR